MRESAIKYPYEEIESLDESIEEPSWEEDMLDSDILVAYSLPALKKGEQTSDYFERVGQENINAAISDEFFESIDRVGGKSIALVMREMVADIVKATFDDPDVQFKYLHQLGDMTDGQVKQNFDQAVCTIRRNQLKERARKLYEGTKAQNLISKIDSMDINELATEANDIALRERAREINQILDSERVIKEMDHQDSAGFMSEIQTALGAEYNREQFAKEILEKVQQQIEKCVQEGTRSVILADIDNYLEIEISHFIFQVAMEQRKLAKKEVATAA
ncbi:MAG: hypothetical protein ABIH67_04075 [Candidatus Uhrbacteria bacterium]